MIYHNHTLILESTYGNSLWFWFPTEAIKHWR